MDENVIIFCAHQFHEHEINQFHEHRHTSHLKPQMSEDARREHMPEKNSINPQVDSEVVIHVKENYFVF